MVPTCVSLSHAQISFFWLSALHFLLNSFVLNYFSLPGEPKLPFCTSVLRRALWFIQEAEMLAAAMQQLLALCVFLLFALFVFCICTVLNSSRSLLPAPVSDIMERVLYWSPKFRREDFPGRVYLGKSPLQVPNTPAPFSNKTTPL